MTMSSHALRHLSCLLLLVLLSTCLPAAPARAASPSPPLRSLGGALTPDPTPVASLVVHNLTYPARPALALDVVLTPDPFPIGNTATFSLTLTNRAPIPADNVVVTAPTPDGVLALRGPVTLSPLAGWRWDVGHLDALSSSVLTGTLLLVRRPS